MTDDFASMAELWDDDDLSPTSAPRHFAGDEVFLFAADSELELARE